MAKAYYSTVLPHSANAVWAVIRSFDQYAWSGVAAETIIEWAKAGDQVGAVRSIALGDGTMRRQVLLAHSDLDRFYTYGLCDPPYLPLRDFIATLRVTPVVETDHAFVEWHATFDCAADERDRWTRYFEVDGFAKWLAALRAFLASRQSRAAQ